MRPGSGSPCDEAVRGQPGKRQRQYGGRQVRRAQVTDGAVLDPQCGCEHGGGREPAVTVIRRGAHTGKEGNDGQDDRLHGECGDEPPAGPAFHLDRQSPPCECAEDESDQGDQ